MYRACFIVWVCLCALACGGGAPDAEAAPTESSGSEAVQPLEPGDGAPETEAPPDPVPESGPASVNVVASVNRQPVPAHVRLIGADGETAAEGDVGAKLTVPSGTYTLEVTVTDAKALADKPTEKREVTLQAGGDTTEVVDFAWSKIKLNVRVNGNLDPKAIVVLLRKGAIVAEIQSASEHVMISPGRYGAQVKTRGAEIEVEEMMFPQGATRETPVNVVTGQ
jgi:hypothetical protein